ncbi:MAG TPA: hypothetical protein VLS28_02160 [Candidatus Sulfomarinibacteraceae bacterium]|nr:hypothetical protein [Candidatus Sulfomarinibacteraceae bacterium]
MTRWIPTTFAALMIGVLVAACGSATPPGGGATASPTTVAPTPSPVAATEEPVPPAALVIQTDTVLGPKNLTEAERGQKICIQLNKFAHNEQIVWRVRVIDGATGERLDDTAVASVELKLPTETLALRYGPHPRDNPLESFWTTSWVVPEGFPSGTVPYTLTAEGIDGRTGSFEQFPIPFAMLTVTDDVRPVIPE